MANELKRLVENLENTTRIMEKLAVEYKEAEDAWVKAIEQLKKYCEENKRELK